MVKTKIEQFIRSWAICIHIAEAVPLDGAIESILKTIASYLEKSKAHLNESNFQDLIHFALQTIQILPKEMRFKRLSYLNGGIQREILRPEYRQLKQQLIRYLQPIPWSSYGFFMAAEVLPAISLVLIIASIPGLALAAKRTESSALAHSDPLCTHILQIDYAQSHLMLQDIKLQLSQMGVDYNKLPIQVDFSVEKIRRHADCFAKTLTQFCTGHLDSIEEASLLNALANEEAYLESLHLIVTYAQNKALRYKIIAKLAQMLYRDIHSAKAFNSVRLIRILGQAIMDIQPEKLSISITKDEIITMCDMLSLYRRIARSESAVNKQILALRAVLKAKESIAPQTTPVKKSAYYVEFLAVFIPLVVVGLLQFFARFLNGALLSPKVNNKQTTMPKQKNRVNMPVANESKILSYSPQIVPSEVMVRKIAAQQNLPAILTQVNELFLDLIIPDPYPLYWIEDKEKQFRLALTRQQYYYDTQGKGKFFSLSRAALSALITEYCTNRLGVEARTIALQNVDLVLEQPLELKVDGNTHSIKQCYATFFKLLRQMATVYFPMDIQLDYHSGEFFIVFNLDKDNCSEINPYTLTPKKFLHCVRNSLNVVAQGANFTISYQTVRERQRLINEQEFLTIKKAACNKKENEFKGQPVFFNLSKIALVSEKNRAITPLKTLKK